MSHRRSFVNRLLENQNVYKMGSASGLKSNADRIPMTGKTFGFGKNSYFIAHSSQGLLAIADRLLWPEEAIHTEPS